jgi:hypothetical protein
MKRFHIDCELGYDVIQQSLFVFNLAIPSTPAQRVVAEAVSTVPSAVTDEFRDEGGHNRFIRIDVGPGPFSIRYQATVEIDTPEAHGRAPETPLAKLPGEFSPTSGPAGIARSTPSTVLLFANSASCPPDTSASKQSASGSGAMSTTSWARRR